MKPSAVIREMRNVLFERGRSKFVTHAIDGSVCLYGALGVARTGRPWDGWQLGHVEPSLIREAIGGQQLTEFNRTASFDEVIDALDRAEKIAESREALDG